MIDPKRDGNPAHGPATPAPMDPTLRRKIDEIQALLSRALAKTVEFGKVTPELEQRAVMEGVRAHLSKIQRMQIMPEFTEDDRRIEALRNAAEQVRRMGADVFSGDLEGRDRTAYLRAAAEIELLTVGEGRRLHLTGLTLEHRAAVLDYVAALQHAESGLGGVEGVVRERVRQIRGERWTPEHDDEHRNGELAMAAACYAAPRLIFLKSANAQGLLAVDPWPWAPEHDKRVRNYRGGGMACSPSAPEDYDRRIRELEKAGALVAAEIDRLRRHRAKYEAKKES